MQIADISNHASACNIILLPRAGPPQYLKTSNHEETSGGQQVREGRGKELAKSKDGAG
jgi:hypothetical protein